MALRIHCITEDSGFAHALSKLTSNHTIPFELVERSPAAMTALHEDSAQADLLLLDVDSVAEQAAELMHRYPETATLVIAGAGTEELLCDLHNRTGCEFLLKDAEQHYLQLLPCMIRKVLRQRDQHETASAMLRSSEKRFEDLLLVIPDIVYKIDPDGAFTFINNAVRQLGYTPQELIGKHFSVLLHPEDAPRVSRRHVLPNMRGNITGPDSAPGLFDERRSGDRCTHGLEVRIRRKGAAPSVVGSVTAYGEIAAVGHYHGRTEQRIFTGTVGIIRDVTQRKRSEEMLRRLSIAIEQSKSAVCIALTDGTVEYTNPYFLRLNGYRPEEVLGRNIYELLNERLQEETLAEIQQAVNAATVYETDTIVWRRNGESYWSWIKIFPVTGIDGRVRSHIFFLEDITERKQSEAWLRQQLDHRERELSAVHEDAGRTMRLIAGLLAPQQDQRLEPQVRHESIRSSTRALTVAVAHEMAATGIGRPEVNLRDYLGTICACLARSYGIDPLTLSVELDFEPVSVVLPLDRAIALGMISNEIIGYAVGEFGVRHLSVDFSSEDQHQLLTIRHGGSDIFDDSRAGDADATRSAETREMATRVIGIVVKHLGGSFTHDGRDGARYTIACGA
ncbi:MAG: PAS domain S-box protein [Spirochaetaceae bacterium]|nr:MAG: PAS domain S-box protein [Spirochaetaceae bacterium]